MSEKYVGIEAFKQMISGMTRQQLEQKRIPYAERLKLIDIKLKEHENDRR